MQGIDRQRPCDLRNLWVAACVKNVERKLERGADVSDVKGATGPQVRDLTISGCSGGKGRVTSLWRVARSLSRVTGRQSPCQILREHIVVAFPKEILMKAIKGLLGRLVKDEQGGEVLEYALIAGLIVVAAIAVISAVGTKVLARWTSLNSSM